MYVFVVSNDSILAHPQNTKAEFISELPRTLSFSGNWECALVDCYIDPALIVQDLIIYTDIVQNSCVHGELIPILNIISASGNIVNPYYIPLSQYSINRIIFKILNREGKKIPVSHTINNTRFVLHFRSIE